MEKTQIILTVLLLIIEVVAFAWLIIDIQKSKKKQDQIIQLEKPDALIISTPPDKPHIT